MEASQEGHLELVKYLIKANANVNAQTGTGDTALTYACENGHTDVADVLLQHHAELVRKLRHFIDESSTICSGSDDNVVLRLEEHLRTFLKLMRVQIVKYPT